MPVTADDLDAAVSTTVTTLRPATGRDWSVPAGALEWDCWHTAEHIGDCLLSYAGQLVAQPTRRFVRFEVYADKDASPAEVLEFAEAGGRILAATVRTSSPQVRGWPPNHHARCAPACSPGCSPTQRLTWPIWTRGWHCCWPPAGSRCPGARGLGTGAGTAPHRPRTDEHCHRGTQVMDIAQTPPRRSAASRPTVKITIDGWSTRRPGPRRLPPCDPALACAPPSCSRCRAPRRGPSGCWSPSTWPPSAPSPGPSRPTSAPSATTWACTTRGSGCCRGSRTRS